MFSTKTQAIALLYEAEECNPGLWIQHSICVANCAEKIADKCGLNTEKAFVLGLLHDIGRKFGITHFSHIVDGYYYMMELRYDEQARICLTHSFPRQRINDYIGNFDVSKNEVNAFSELLNKCHYDDYDKLIQLCDALSGTDIMEMNKRMDDVANRYGHYPEGKRKANLELKEYFEHKAKENIYRLVTENILLWGL